MSDRNSSRSFRWLPWLFGLSLLINGGFLGGFVYHRYLMPPPQDRLDQAQRILSLSDEQRAALATIQRALRDEARDNFHLTRERHQELVVLLRQEPMNMQALELHLRATTEPQVAMQRDVILRLLAFRDTLNPAQKALFNEKIEHPGFMLRLAGFPKSMWRPHDGRKKGGGAMDGGPIDGAPMDGVPIDGVPMDDRPDKTPPHAHKNIDE
jgi:uncharacterized membrane protein